MKKAISILFFLFITTIFFVMSSCHNKQDKTAAVVNEVLSDSEVKIGNQIWMNKNLSITKFNNGDTIPEAKTPEEWLNAFEQSKPAWCFYNNDSLNGKKYGRLYNWYAVNDTRGLAPKGWQIPSQWDWETLKEFCDSAYGTQMNIDSLTNMRLGTAELLVKKDWGKDCEGDNKTGFSGLPAGSRDSLGAFHFINNATGWWSSSQAHPENLYDKNKYPLCSYFFNMNAMGKDYRNTASQAFGFSVRCLR